MLNHSNLKNQKKQESYQQILAKVSIAGVLLFLVSCGTPDIKETSISSLEITNTSLNPLELEEADPNNSGFLSPLQQEAKNLSGSNIIMAYNSMGTGDTLIYKQQKDLIIKNKLLLLKNKELFNQNKYQLVLVPSNFDNYKTYTTNAEALKIIETLNDSDTSNDIQAQDLFTNNGITKIVVINSKVDKIIYGIDKDPATIFENIEGKTLKSLGDQIVKLNTNLATFVTNKGTYNTNFPEDTQLPVADLYYVYSNNDLEKPSPETAEYLKNKYVLSSLTVDQAVSAINNNMIEFLAQYYKYIDKTVTIPTTLDQFVNLVYDIETKYIDLKLQEKTISENKSLDKETRDLELKKIKNKLEQIKKIMDNSKNVLSNIFGSAINNDNLPSLVYASSLAEDENTLKTNVTNEVQELQKQAGDELQKLVNQTENTWNWDTLPKKFQDQTYLKMLQENSNFSSYIIEIQKVDGNPVLFFDDAKLSAFLTQLLNSGDVDETTAGKPTADVQKQLKAIKQKLKEENYSTDDANLTSQAVKLYLETPPTKQAIKDSIMAKAVIEQQKKNQPRVDAINQQEKKLEEARRRHREEINPGSTNEDKGKPKHTRDSEFGFDDIID